MSSSDDIRLPSRYAPVRHLADGGMATVWEARDTVLERHVAVKLLSPALAADPDARERFTREARAAARLSAHPHVVTIHDAGEEGGHAYIVMSLASGGTVADRLAAGPLDRDVALRWLHDAADALDAAHAEGIVHRDVKPANLLLDGRDRVLVGDFGIATAGWASSVTQTGHVVGTAGYLAPEQREGRAATPASDRYAFALVARELLSGERPGGAARGPVRALPPAVDDVLGRGAALDPDARPTSCRALVAELERSLGDAREATAVLPVAESPTATMATEAAPRPRPRRAAAPPPAEPQSRPAAAEDRDAPGRRRAAPVAFLAAGLLALGVGAAVLAADGGEGGPAAEPAETSQTGDTAPDETATQATTEAAPAPAPAPEPAPAEDPRALNDRGYELFLAGRYAEAIPLLERAVAGLESTPEDEYYAYALYNLGASLRRAGRPGEAIPLLERRLEVSDFKRGVVLDELDAAYADAGLEPPSRDGGDEGDDEEAAGKKEGKGPKDD